MQMDVCLFLNTSLCFPETWLISEDEMLQNFLHPFVTRKGEMTVGNGVLKTLFVSSTALSAETCTNHTILSRIYCNCWLSCIHSVSALHKELPRFPWWFAFWLFTSSEDKSFS